VPRKLKSKGAAVFILVLPQDFGLKVSIHSSQLLKDSPTDF